MSSAFRNQAKCSLTSTAGNELRQHPSPFHYDRNLDCWLLPPLPLTQAARGAGLSRCTRNYVTPLPRTSIHYTILDACLHAHLCQGEGIIGFHREASTCCFHYQPSPVRCLPPRPSSKEGEGITGATKLERGAAATRGLHGATLFITSASQSIILLFLVTGGRVLQLPSHLSVCKS